jgi:hypothetical protein
LLEQQPSSLEQQPSSLEQQPSSLEQQPSSQGRLSFRSIFSQLPSCSPWVN